MPKILFEWLLLLFFAFWGIPLEHPIPSIFATVTNRMISLKKDCIWQVSESGWFTEPIFLVGIVSPWHWRKHGCPGDGDTVWETMVCLLRLPPGMVTKTWVDLLRVLVQSMSLPLSLPGPWTLLPLSKDLPNPELNTGEVWILSAGIFCSLQV